MPAHTSLTPITSCPKSVGAGGLEPRGAERRILEPQPGLDLSSAAPSATVGQWLLPSLVSSPAGDGTRLPTAYRVRQASMPQWHLSPGRAVGRLRDGEDRPRLACGPIRTTEPCPDGRARDKLLPEGPESCLASGPQWCWNEQPHRGLPSPKHSGTGGCEHGCPP